MKFTSLENYDSTEFISMKCDLCQAGLNNTSPSRRVLQSKKTPFHGVFVSQLVWDALSDGVKMVCSCAVGRELKGSFHSWGEMRERAGSLQPLIQHTTTQAPPTHSNALSMTPGSKTETQNLKQIYKASFSGWIPHILNHKQLSNFPK